MVGIGYVKQWAELTSIAPSDSLNMMYSFNGGYLWL